MSSEISTRDLIGTKILEELNVLSYLNSGVDRPTYNLKEIIKKLILIKDQVYYNLVGTSSFVEVYPQVRWITNDMTVSYSNGNTDFENVTTKVYRLNEYNRIIIEEVCVGELRNHLNSEKTIAFSGDVYGGDISRYINADIMMFVLTELTRAINEYYK